MNEQVEQQSKKRESRVLTATCQLDQVEFPLLDGLDKQPNLLALLLGFPGLLLSVWGLVLVLFIFMGAGIEDEGVHVGRQLLVDCGDHALEGCTGGGLLCFCTTLIVVIMMITIIITILLSSS